MSNVITFPAARPGRPASDEQTRAEVTAIDNRPVGQRLRERRLKLPLPATETGKNSRIRLARRAAWWRAERMVDYLHARMDWNDALVIAQKYEIGDSASFPSAEHKTRHGLLDKWREAVAKLLLTPAPDIAAVTWKRRKLLSGDFRYVPVTKERVQRVIDEDEAFLKAHPTRRNMGRAAT